MKIKIISDGTTLNTKVVNAETEEKVEGVTNIEIFGSCQFGHGLMKCKLEISNVKLDLKVDAEVNGYTDSKNG